MLKGHMGYGMLLPQWVGMVMFLLVLGLVGGTAMASPPPPTQDWVLVFEEDFEGSEINTTRWTVNNFTIHGNSELELYMSDEVWLDSNVVDGNETASCLVLQTERRNLTYSNGVHYNFASGWVSTIEKVYFTFGKWEIRAKMPSPEATSAWPALWLMPNPSTANPVDVCWPVGGEIDILEQVCNTHWNPVWGSYHWGVSCMEDKHPLPGAPYPPIGSPSIDFSQDFHIFSVEWNSTTIEWFVDGESYYVRTADEVNVPQDPFYLIINTAVSPLLLTPPPTAQYPAYHYVDWVRVYQLSNATTIDA